MNGQDKTQPHLSSDQPSSSTTAPNGSAAPNGSGSSWLKDMMSNPLRAAQVNLLNRSSESGSLPLLQGQIDASSLAHGFGYPPYSFMFGSNPLPALASMGDAAASSAAPVPIIINQVDQPQQQQLLMQAAAAAAYHGDLRPPSGDKMAPGSSSKDGVSLKHHVTTMPPNTNNEHPAKRSRIDPNQSLIAPATVTAASVSSTSDTVPGTNKTPASIPHRPEYFRKGSIIQLGDNKLKRIEDLTTNDFELSSRFNPDLCLDCSTVTRIAEEPNRGTGFLSFSIGEQHRDQVDVTVEATLEHPFFVYNQGWSSVSPERTLNFYNLTCHQLRVGDRCISLTFKDGHTSHPNNTPTTTARASAAAATSSAIVSKV